MTCKVSMHIVMSPFLLSEFITSSPFSTVVVRLPFANFSQCTWSVFAILFRFHTQTQESKQDQARFTLRLQVFEVQKCTTRWQISSNFYHQMALCQTQLQNLLPGGVLVPTFATRLLFCSKLGPLNAIHCLLNKLN